MLAPVSRLALWAGLAVLCLSGAALADPGLVGTSKRFAVYCQKNANCDRMANIADQAQSLLVDIEAAYGWLKDLGFPVERATLNKVNGKMPIYIEGNDLCGRTLRAARVSITPTSCMPELASGASVRSPAPALRSQRETASVMSSALARPRPRSCARRTETVTRC